MIPRHIVAVFLVLSGWATPVLAHWGHVGELAGHGHIIGIGAFVAAAALAAALAAARRRARKEADPDADEEDAEEAVPAQ